MTFFQSSTAKNWSPIYIKQIYLLIYIDTETVVRRCSVKIVFLEISQNSQESTCDKVSFLIKLKETSAQALSCESCEISKNTLQNTSGGYFYKYINMNISDK